ncbi:MAG: excinuclease ABC subunit UvrA [Lentimicrobiaceae bacterium]|jgi:excinuclease ABC subunit A|nr:excinuclease ABC subunit UvrA [Lentimicrobiaceae bacterium]MBT3453597.1 excinuclease ABC subunit UvrA [Lentimicrobiaceae bacterium]MBT3817793.1 excinuclease ABC subunit UvrA [Lentimicrobiaceae bacterium]MBT4061119.1 excinuclease ABC subunit UvrA [Lentimicrobiaceae bacterium]MBT4191056.1 excinuclease ABC subunit UvrA [Lentimicrobiaceae bacterium]
MNKNPKITEDNLEVLGARVHNLKNIDVTIPRNKFVVITGLSGSGKSSLAFDTIYAEGQRRYMETFSAYARQFIGNMERPDVDKISGLSPVISIEQKSVNRNPRSTVGTITEVYDFLRLLYARASKAYSYETGEQMVQYTEDQIVELIMKANDGKKITVLSPLVKGRKGHYRELFENIRQQGYLKVRVDSEIREISFGLQLDRYKVHDIEVVVDRLIVKDKDKDRIKRTINSAMKLGKGSLMVILDDNDEVRHYSSKLMCPTTGMSYDEPEPNTFSFNSPYGACPSCNGLGYVKEVDMKKVFPDPKLSIKRGGIAPLGEHKNNWVFNQIEAIGLKYGYELTTPVGELSDNALKTILHGSNQTFEVKKEYLGITSSYTLSFEGLIKYIENYSKENSSQVSKKWADSYMNRDTCSECNGERLKKESLHFLINEKNISELSLMDISNLRKWLDDAETNMDERQVRISHEILREIKTRLEFLLDVGIGYLNLFRSARSLSGGESQRIRLATQIGSQLTGVLYILDEPSIGLHQRDNLKLISALKNLRDIGNSVIVVEHDKDTILSADHVIDIGPGAGMHGGEIVAQGDPVKIKNNGTITAEYLSGSKKIEVPKKRREGNSKNLTLKGASGNNLKNVDATFPLGKLICITGVSGSGKSSLINNTLYPILSNHFYKSSRNHLPYESIDGVENIDKVIEIDQSPIGRTPRSNPATYTKVFDEIRKLYGSLSESKIRGYKPGRFSFNVKGGRCETCKGAGMQVIEMNFLPDVYVHCNDCFGKRYNRETLEVRYKGKSINDVLDMTINQAIDFFENIHFIITKLKALQDVGLGYLTLGQSSTTISGGEAQRVKLASELSKRDTGNTLYILDEPTTGLHFEDVKVLLGVLNKLVDKGNTIIIIEHNMEVVKVADHIIDLGPEGGEKGGQLICFGTPEQIIKNTNSCTAPFIKNEL